MIVRLLLRAGVALVASAAALGIAAALVDGVIVQAAGFVAAVVVYTAAQTALSPVVTRIARKRASAVLGGVGIVSALLALWIATLLPGGIRISGLSAWVVAPLVVWLVTAVLGWLLGVLVVERGWDRRVEARRAARRAG